MSSTSSALLVLATWNSKKLSLSKKGRLKSKRMVWLSKNILGVLVLLIVVDYSLACVSYSQMINFEFD